MSAKRVTLEAPSMYQFGFFGVRAHDLSNVSDSERIVWGRLDVRVTELGKNKNAFLLYSLSTRYLQGASEYVVVAVKSKFLLAEFSDISRPSPVFGDRGSLFVLNQGLFLV